MEDIIPKGATVQLVYTIVDNQSLFNGSTAIRFSLKDNDDTYLKNIDTLTSTLQHEDNKYAYTVELSSAFTKSLELGEGRYFYDVTLLMNDEGDKKYPLMVMQSITVVDTVGARYSEV